MGRYALLLVGLSACRFGFDDRAAPNDPLAVEMPASTNVNSAIALAVTGGEAPYTFAIVSGPGTLDPAGVFRTPPFPADTTIAITDDTGEAIETTIHAAGQYLFSVGGSSGGVANDFVYRSGDGTTWDLVGTLPGVRAGGALLVFDDDLFYFAGTDGSVRHDQIWRSADGVTWTDVGVLPNGRQSIANSVFHDQIFLGGGYSATTDFNTNIWTSTDGVTFADNPLPTPLHGTVYVPFHDKLWMFGGHDANGFMDQVSSAPDGVTWSLDGAIPIANEYHGATVYQDRVWLAGGTQLADRVVSSADGLVWRDEGRMPVSRSDAQILPWNGELWILTGNVPQVLHSSDGLTWNTAGMYPLMVSGARAAQFTPH